MECQQCGTDIRSRDLFCGACGASLSAPEDIGLEAIQGNVIRYHGLDTLRGIAMLLGIVLHAALPYTSNMEAFWPTDEGSSDVVTSIFQFIHMWRMPLFFILAGFFAHSVINRHSWTNWWGNRLLRIGLPVMIFFPLMSLTVPWVFHYGETREFVFFYSTKGQPFHLWFLWHLLIFVIFTTICRFHYLVGLNVLDELSRVGLGFIDNALRKSKSVLSRILFQPRFPLIFIIVCCFINFETAGELIINPIASFLYFVLGYSLYRNSSLLMFLKANWSLYLLFSIVGFAVFMVVSSTTSSNFLTGLYISDVNGVAGKVKMMDVMWNLQYLLRITCGILFSYAFIGLAESRFSAYNAKLRFISDGSYWMYLIHMPIVALITFSMFDLQIAIELKFLIAIAVTSIICLGTYKYFVRSTFIGLLLNGKRHPFNVAGHN